MAEIDHSDFSNKQSLVSHLTNSQKFFSEEPFTFSETGGLQGPYPSPKEPNVFCIKNSKFKLIYYKTPDEYELYDLKNDPEEKINLFGRNLPIEIELMSHLMSWINR